MGMSIGSATMENSMEGPQKIKNRASMWTRNSIFGYLSKENENTNSKRYMLFKLKKKKVDYSRLLW